MSKHMQSNHIYLVLAFMSWNWKSWQENYLYFKKFIYFIPGSWYFLAGNITIVTTAMTSKSITIFCHFCHSIMMKVQFVLFYYVEVGPSSELYDSYIFCRSHTIILWISIKIGIDPILETVWFKTSIILILFLPENADNPNLKH